MGASKLFKVFEKFGIGIIIFFVVITLLVIDAVLNFVVPFWDNIALIIFVSYLFYKYLFSSLSFSNRAMLVSNFYLMNKKPNKAVNYLRKQIAKRKVSELNFTSINLKIVEIYYKDGNYKAASKYLDECLKSLLNQKKGYILSLPIVKYFQIYINNNERDKAIGFYEDLIKNKVCSREDRVENILHEYKED
jgi:tetratricopeptide (TPR) repeat protein